MKKISTLLLALSLVLCTLFALTLNASAASTEVQNGLEVTITTDKTDYNVNEDITVTVSVKNNNQTNAENLSIQTLLPEGLVLKSGNLVVNNIDVQAQSTYTTTVVAVLPGQTEPEVKPDDDKTDSPQTGEHDIVIIAAVAAFSAAGIVLMLKSKKSAKVMSMFLCLVMIAAVLPANTFAAEDDTVITVDTAVKVNGTSYTITAKVANDSSTAIQLRCTESEIFTNIKTTVYFYAQTSVEVESISLYNANTNELICQMFDDGKYSLHGDDLQGDGVYSCKIEMCENTANTNLYVALSNTGISSNRVELSIVIPLTDEEISEIENVNNTLSEEIGNNNNLSGNDIKNILDKLSNSELNGGKSQIKSDSIHYDTENGLVSFEYSSGVTGFVKLEDFPSGENAIAGINTLSEKTEQLLKTDKYGKSTVENKSIVKTVGDAVIMYSFDDPKNSLWLKEYEACRDTWTEKGLITKIYTEPTVKDYRTAFLEKDLIVIAEYGGYLSAPYKTSIIITKEEASTAKNYLYSSDLKSQRIFIATLGDGSNVYCLTPDFFEFYYGADKLDGSIVYMDNGFGFGRGDNLDNGFAEAFVKGASAETVYGYHEAEYIKYGLSMMDCIVSELLDGKKTGEALADAKDVIGNTDDEYAQKNQPHWDNSNHTTATPVIFGSTEMILSRTDFINGSFELGLDGWNTTGDVRVINKLAEFVPMHGKKMAILTTGIGSSENEYLEGTEGSIMLQSFEVENGSTKISLSYNVISEEPLEYVNSGYNDKVIIELLDKNGKTISQLGYESVNTSKWYLVKNIDFEGGDHTTYSTLWKEVVYEDLNKYVGEKVTLRIRIWDVGDSRYDTAVLIDNIRVQ